MNPEKSIAILDFDGTLIEGQSQQLLVAYLFKCGYISFTRYVVIMIWYIGYKLNILTDIQKVTEYALSYLKDKSVADWEKIFDTFFEKVCVPRIYPSSHELVLLLKERGMNTVLVSTAIDPIISRAQKYLGIDNYISTCLGREGGRYTGKIDGQIIYSELKPQVVREYISDKGFDLTHSFAFADHASDIPLLASVGHPVAVNALPGLESWAKDQSLPMLYLNNDESFQHFKSNTLS